MGAPQVAPALLISTSSLGSRSATAAASPVIPSIFDRSKGRAVQLPNADSSSARASQTAALRDEI